LVPKNHLKEVKSKHIRDLQDRHEPGRNRQIFGRIRQKPGRNRMMSNRKSHEPGRIRQTAGRA
jgi:hypothetical protein